MIYDKPVRLLMRDFVEEVGIVKGQIITREQVISWFKTHYSLIQAGTVSAHLIRMSTNAPSRFHYKANPNGDDDLFFQIDGSRFRLYDLVNDPTPIYYRESRDDVAKTLPWKEKTVLNSWQKVDIEKNIQEYVYGDNKAQGIMPLERYASFDYCFNYFQSFREQNRLDELADDDHIQESCLQVGFYLASWGMLRASTFLFDKSVKVYESLIRAIAGANPKLWEIDANCYTPDNIRLILDFGNAIAKTLNFGNGPSDTLKTKIMLGVFGNVPAFDSYFTKGFGVSSFGKRALERVADFYCSYKAVIEINRLATLDFMTGQPTSRLYTRAKVIDMIFFIEGVKKNRNKKV